MKLAIIGASTGQVPLCIKAKQMGLTTICFAWEDGAVCRELVDVFYPISVLEKEKILDICKKEHVDGIVSNASDLLAWVVSYLTDNMGLNGNKFSDMNSLLNKYEVRRLTKDVEGLAAIPYCLYNNQINDIYPCVVKPIKGASKRGVSFVENAQQFNTAVEYATTSQNEIIIIEEYVGGKEYSVETISYHGKHFILQITEKDCSGPPHFVELGHHQPAAINIILKNRISRIISQVLDKVHFQNGASHTEIKIRNNEIYLIEINPRGGGDFISSSLVELSTGYDYIKGMIEVALDIFKEPIINKKKYAGVYYLCKQTESYYNSFEEATGKQWLIETNFHKGIKLQEASGNYNRDAYLIYCSKDKIIL